MTIKEIAAACQTNCVELSRIDWALTLKGVPKQSDPILEQMRADLLLGVTRAVTDTVLVTTSQVRAMCELLPSSSSFVPVNGDDHS